MSRGIEGGPVSGVSVWRVPGRIEVLGKHTDYAGGRSLVAASEQAVTVAGHLLSGSRASGASESTVVYARSSLMSAEVVVRPGELSAPGHWSAYVQAAVDRLAANFGPLGEVRLELTSTLPLSSGMSSSSAVVVGVASVLADLAELRDRMLWRSQLPDRLALAGYFATMENGLSFGALEGSRGVGTFGGSEDHTAMMSGVSRSLVQFQYSPTVHERTVELSDDVRFVVAVSGVLAEKSGPAREAYNAVSDRVSEVLRRARLVNPSFATLRDAMREAPDRVRALVSDSPVLMLRLEQFVTESEELVPAGADAFAASDWTTLGEVTEASQRLAETHLGNQVPETVALARSARELGAYASSAFGAGFGGSVWALVPVDAVDEFAREWEQRYRAAFPNVGPDTTFLSTHASGPAERVG